MNDLNFSKEIPDEFFEKLGEYSYGGFILFYFDSDGTPRCQTCFTEQSESIALQKFALDFLEISDKASRERMLEQFLGEHHQPEQTGDSP